MVTIQNSEHKTSAHSFVLVLISDGRDAKRPRKKGPAASGRLRPLFSAGSLLRSFGAR